MAYELNFKECAELIASVGKNITVLVRGEAGIGKSSLAQYLKDTYYPDHHLIMFDAATRSEGDVALPWLATIDGHQVTTYAATELLGLHLEGPSIIMIDELTKATTSTVNALLPAILERRFNTQKFHPETLVMASGNLAIEMLGDNLLDHQLNRMMDVVMRKPRLVDEFGQPDEWLRDFAIPRKVAPSAIAFCKDFPEIFADFNESTKNNKYIKRPGEMQGQFVTPRSFWHMCAYHLPKQNEMSENAFFAGMVGLVGKACAIDFMTFLKLESTLPDTALVVADPAGAPMPNGPVCQLMMTYKLAYTVKAPTVNQIVAYVKRLDGEMRGLFTHIVTSTSGTIGLIPHLQKLGMLADNVNLRTA